MVATTAASLAYNWVTDSREQPATKLYDGPFLAVGSTLVAYRQWGASGTPIILVGGFAEPTFVWDGVGRRLAGHRVIAIDMPPFGYTQRAGAYSLSSWVALVRGVVIRLGLHDPVIVGHSLGAAVAVGYALTYPNQVHAITLVDGDALAGSGRPGFLSTLLIDPFYTTIFRIATSNDALFLSLIHI